MEKMDNFKKFIKKNPTLIKYVKNGEMNWQKFYEIYDLYGEESSAWSEYLKKEEKVVEDKTKVASVSDFFSFLKGIDLDSLQETVSSLQRVLGVFSDLGNKGDVKVQEEYKPRPLYKHFDD